MTDNTATISRLVKTNDTLVRTIVKLDGQRGLLEEENRSLTEDLCFLREDLEAVLKEREELYARLDGQVRDTEILRQEGQAANDKLRDARDRKELVITNQREELKSLRARVAELEHDLRVTKPLGDGSRVRVTQAQDNRGFGVIPEGATGVVLSWDKWDDNQAHVHWDDVDGGRPSYWGADLIKSEFLVHA